MNDDRFRKIIDQMTEERPKKVLYYYLMGGHPFVVIEKQTENGWYWWDIWEKWTFPLYYGKSKPRLDRGEKYIVSKDFDTVRPIIESLMFDWKKEILTTHHLEHDAHDFLEDIFYRNRARCFQYFITKYGEVVTLKTSYGTSMCNGGEWRQQLSIIGDGMFRRSFYRQSDDERVLINPGIPQVTLAEAREAAIRIIDSQIENYLMDVRRFCGVEE